jgi:CspA family cold shock protein
MVRRGKVVRFDEVRGYGFIAPDGGGEDVFVHANDLGPDKPLVGPGSIVEFDVEEGERGLKTSWVRLIKSPVKPSVSAAARALRTSDDDDDGLCDVLSPAQLSREVTDALIEEVPSLTGVQIKAVRHEMTKIARRHRWVEDPQAPAGG